MPTSTRTDIESRTHHSLPQTCRSKTAGLVKLTTCTTKRGGDLFVVTLALCHTGGTPSRGTALEYALSMPRTALIPSLPAALRIARTRFKMTHTSNDLVTRTEIYKHTKHKSVSWKKNFPIGRCADLTRRSTATANLVAHIRTLHRCNLQDTCATMLVGSLPPEFTRLAQRAGNHGAFATPPTRKESTLTQID